MIRNNGANEVKAKYKPSEVKLSNEIVMANNMKNKKPLTDVFINWLRKTNLVFIAP